MKGSNVIFWSQKPFKKGLQTEVESISKIPESTDPLFMTQKARHHNHTYGWLLRTWLEWVFSPAAYKGASLCLKCTLVRLHNQTKEHLSSLGYDLGKRRFFWTSMVNQPWRGLGLSLSPRPLWTNLSWLSLSLRPLWTKPWSGFLWV